MSRPRTVAAAAVLWCVVVAAVASLVWVVIDRAGEGVVPTSQAEAPGTGSLPVPHHPRPSATPSGPSGGHHTVSGGPTTAPPGPTGSPSGIQPPTVPVRRESWSGTAGHLVAQCRGPVGSLVSAYPNAGWGYAIESRGPNVVRVRYKRVGEDRFVTVSAQCVNGTPGFSVSATVPGDD
jgi:hypothetical protein